MVKLPCPEDILDQIQAKHTNDILENLGGLEIRRLDSVVYGHRWGSSRIYWGLCKHEQSQTARELSKNTPEPVYFFRNYISGELYYTIYTLHDFGRDFHALTNARAVVLTKESYIISCITFRMRLAVKHNLYTKTELLAIKKRQVNSQ